MGNKDKKKKLLKTLQKQNLKVLWGKLFKI